jgi:thioredoxin-dependent peroxiredoxin
LRGTWEEADATFETALREHPVATPAGWQVGEDVMLSLMVSDEQAKELYGDFKAPKPYIRIIPEPS